MKVKLDNPQFTEKFGENLLRYRGITDIDWYLEPVDDKYLQSPLDLENISEACAVLSKAVASDKKILIIFDSDNDGFTSGAIIYQYIKHMAPSKEIDYWLHENKQHGLEDHIDRLLECEQDYELVICPDSSSNDFEYHEKLSIPCLVLDHHLAEEPFSKNAIIVNNQLSPKYINKDLTGAGVVWQFCRYMDIIRCDNYADNLIDLAAWGIVGDMGSLLSYENRYIIYNGFRNIKNIFFQSLCDKQTYSMNNRVNPMTVSFYIVPLTNAMIRVGTKDEKERLALAYIDGKALVPSQKRGAKGTDELVAIESARECGNARNHQNKIKEDVVGKLEMKIFKNDLLENKVLFVRLDDEDVFPSELTGLIAMELAAKYKRPTMVGRLNGEGYDKGSIRGLNGSELTSFKDFLDESGYFEYVQGHANAAGFSLNDKSLREFHNYANEKLKDIDFGEKYYNVNFECDGGNSQFIKDLTFDLDKYSDLWGQNNDEPLVSITNLRINKKNINVCGKNLDTVQIKKDDITYVKFHAKEMIEELSQYDDVKLNIVGRTNVNEWAGRSSAQIMVDNYEILRDSIVDF